MYQSSNKQPPLIIYFILNSNCFATVLISSNKYFFMLLGSIWIALYGLIVNTPRNGYETYCFNSLKQYLGIFN